MRRIWQLMAFDLGWGLRILVGLVLGAVRGMAQEALRLEQQARCAHRRRFGQLAERSATPETVLPAAPDRPRALSPLTDQQARDLAVMVAAAAGAISFASILLALFLHVQGSC